MLELQVKINNRSPFTLEKRFTTEWGKKLKLQWYYFDKISDASLGMKKVDCYIWTNVNFYTCEIKMIDNKIFRISQLRDNQYAALKTAMKLKAWKSIVVVYSKKLDKYTIIPFSVIEPLPRDSAMELTFKDAC